MISVVSGLCLCLCLLWHLCSLTDSLAMLCVLYASNVCGGPVVPELVLLSWYFHFIYSACLCLDVCVASSCLTAAHG
jgi:hypothetical protein